MLLFLKNVEKLYYKILMNQIKTTGSLQRGILDTNTNNDKNTNNQRVPGLVLINSVPSVSTTHSDGNSTASVCWWQSMENYNEEPSDSDIPIGLKRMRERMELQSANEQRMYEAIEKSRNEALQAKKEKFDKIRKQGLKTREKLKKEATLTKELSQFENRYKESKLSSSPKTVKVDNVHSRKSTPAKKQYGYSESLKDKNVPYSSSFLKSVKDMPCLNKHELQALKRIVMDINEEAQQHKRRSSSRNHVEGSKHSRLSDGPTLRKKISKFSNNHKHRATVLDQAIQIISELANKESQNNESSESSHSVSSNVTSDERSISSESLDCHQKYQKSREKISQNFLKLKHQKSHRNFKNVPCSKNCSKFIMDPKFAQFRERCNEINKRIDMLNNKLRKTEQIFSQTKPHPPNNPIVNKLASNAIDDERFSSFAGFKGDSSICRHSRNAKNNSGDLPRHACQVTQSPTSNTFIKSSRRSELNRKASSNETMKCANKKLSISTQTDSSKTKT